MITAEDIRVSYGKSLRAQAGAPACPVAPEVTGLMKSLAVAVGSVAPEPVPDCKQHKGRDPP